MSHIDAIRAVAVLFVMWTHFAVKLAPIAGSEQWINATQYYGNFGRIGVVVFFALSGLLIPNSLNGPIGSGTRQFLIRRFLRLYPTYWLSIPIGFFAYWMLFGMHVNTAGWLANATMLPDALGQTPMMPHYWTLETELAFYALCLGLFWLGGIQQMRVLCIVCAALSAAFVVTSALHIIPANALGQYKGMLFHLSIMFWGACFRKAYDHPEGRVVLGFKGVRALRADCSYKRAFLSVTGIVVFVSLLIGAAGFKQHDVSHVIESFSYLAALAIFSVLATVWKIHLRFFAWLGRISYSMYLLHSVPVYVIFWLCSREGWTGGPLALYMIPSAVLAVGLSWLSFIAVEAPCIWLAHALTSTRRAKATDAVYAGEPAQEKWPQAAATRLENLLPHSEPGSGDTPPMSGI
ncbi:acyltransferase [Burkholderia sp. S171]|uniref:acyltransferase family protein n=1 Tax=Burkholderia sp. S171 TaxID=1641860 RepID=UPI0020B1047E|nr:acyltransferase [Burkholderia sp. S171]